MPLTPTIAWLEACDRADAELVVLVEIYNGTDTWQALTSSVRPESNLRLSSTPVAVSAIGQLGVRLDPVTRETQVGEMTVTVDDDWLRPIAVNNRLDRQRIRLRMGEASLNSEDFLLFFTGVIDRLSPSDDFVHVNIVAHERLEALARNYIVGAWFNANPLECLYKGDGSGVLEKAGIDGFVSASFDRTEPQYADIENAVVSRVSHQTQSMHGNRLIRHDGALDFFAKVDGNESILTPTPALLPATELCRLMHAHLGFNELGEAQLFRYDPTAPNIDTWTEHDVEPGTTRQVGATGDNVTNRVVWRFGDPEAVYEANDEDSQSALAYPGEGSRIESKTFSTEWINGMFVGAQLVGTTDTTMTLLGDHLHACSGNRADMTVDSDSPVYLLLQGALQEDYPDGEVSEMLKATAFSRSSDILSKAWYWDPSAGSYTVIDEYSSSIDVTGITRNWPDGGPGLDHGALVQVHDATLPVIHADRILARFKYGSPTIERTTNVRKIMYLVGDFVGHEFNKFLGYGLDGLDGSEKWEIIGKEMTFGGGKVDIKWLFSLVTTDTLNRTVNTSHRSIWGSQFSLSSQQSIAQPYRRSGFALSAVSGLNGLIAVGSADNGIYSAQLGTPIQRAFAASKDTYVTLNVRTSGMSFKAVANGAAAPTVTNEELLLGKVVTDGSSITSIDTDDVATLPIPGSRLASGSGPLSYLNAGGELDSFQRVLDRNLDLVTDGTTYKRLVGVNASNVLTNASVDAAAGIDGSKLAAGSGPLANLSAAGALDSLSSVTSRSLDLITDGSTYRRVTGVTSNQITNASVSDSAAVAGSKLAAGSGPLSSLNSSGVLQVGGLADGVVSSPLHVASNTLGFQQFNRYGGWSGRTLNANRFGALVTRG